MNNPGDLGGAPGKTLLYVHGRNFKPAAEDLMDICVSALACGVGRDFPDLFDEFTSLTKRIAYYGDITDDFLTSHGERYDEILDIGDRRNALNALRGYDKKKHFGVVRYDRLPGKTAIAEFAADVFAPLLATLGLSEQLIRKVGIDLAEYWNPDSDFGPRIRERVRLAICSALDSGDRLMLISHGTGCIATYDVLWQLSHDERFSEQYAGKKIDLWLTMGAPLGDTMVLKRLAGAREQAVRKYPVNVVSWHNMAAEDDFVAHDNTLADDFSQMLEQHQVSCIRDYRIYNLAVRYGKSNPHASLGYLVHPRAAQVIVEWMQQAPVNPMPKSIF